MDYGRKINLVGDIDESMYSEFIARLDEIEESIPKGPIYIELSSHGGDALIAIALHDRILASKNTVIINAYGIVASAAVLILAAGDKRIMSPNSWVMVHEDLVNIEEDSRVSRAESRIKISRMLEDQWNKLLEARTKVHADRWASLHKDEAYLSATDCLTLGLIDKIL